MLLFGAYHSSGSAAGFLDGRMDDIRIFRRPITQSEITRLASHRGVIGPALPEGLGDEQVWLSPTITGNNANIANIMASPAKYESNAEVVASTGEGGTKAFEFGGTNERVRVGQQQTFENNKPRSISYWVKPTSVNALQIHVGKMEGTSDYTGWNCNQQSDGSARFSILRAGTTTMWVAGRTPASVFTANTWSHVAVTWEGNSRTSIQIFVDGVKQDLTFSTSQTWNTTHLIKHDTDLCIGNRDEDNTYRLTGQMDDIRLYSRVLNAEISHLSQSRGVTGKPRTYRKVVEDSVTVPLQEQATTVYCKQTNIAGTLSDTSTSSRFVEGPTKNLPNAIKFVASHHAG